MKYKFLSFALMAASLFVSSNLEAKKLHTIGDSTMDGYAGGNTDKLGWGAALQQFMNGTDASSNGITVNNRGKSGSSSRTFYTDSRYWATMVTGGSDAMQSGDILLIQFAHNDENNKGMDAVELQTYNAANGLTPITDLRGTIPTTTYKAYLRLYIDEAKAMGVKPVLVSAICRNYFNGATIKASGRHNLKDGYSVLTETGVLENQKLTTDDHSMDYTYQMEQVALEYADVPYINLTEATASMFETLGAAYCAANIFNVGDGTHTGPLGATLVARCFANAVLTTAAAETNAGRKAVLDELAQYVSLNSSIALSPESMDFGSNYVGTPVVKTFNLAGFDITPATGTYTIAASEGYEVSLDGENYAASLTPAYEGGNIFATISVRGTTATSGTMAGSLTITCGDITKTASLTMEGILNTTGTESQVLWTMADGNATAAVTGDITAGEEVLSGLVLGSPTYQEINSVKYRRYKTSEAWPDQMDEVTDRYIQFSAEVPTGKNFRLDGIEMDVVAVATNNLRCRIYYATKADFTDAVQVKEFTSMVSNTVEHVSVMPMKNLTAGDNVFVRIYPWMQGASASGKYLALGNVTIHGYAEDIPTFEPDSIVWNLKGNTTDFATQVNLNGDGTNTPSYTFNGLTFVGEKQAKDPAVEYINSTYGFHINGGSNNTRRYIQYTPEYDGVLSVTFQSNNKDNEREAFVGPDCTTTNALGSGKSSASATTFTAELTAGTTYYVYSNSGVSFHKLQYNFNRPIGGEPDPETPAEPITATWDFTAMTTGQVNIQGTNSSDVASDVEGISMHVISTGGKLYGKAGDDRAYAQMNTNTELQIPVVSTEDVVNVKSYYGFTYTIGGVTASSLDETYTATAADVAQGYVSIVATGTIYPTIISVVQHPGAVTPEPEEAEPIIWRFEAAKIENGAAFAPRGNNVFVSEDGAYKLTYKGNSDSDALVAASATINGTVYSSYVNLNGTTSSGRTMSFTGIDGTGRLTIVFAAGKTNNTAVTINEATYNGTPLATLNAAAQNLNNSAVTTGLLKLTGSKAYYINGIRSVYAVIWEPSNEVITDCIVTYFDANGTSILKTETVAGGSALAFSEEAAAAVTVPSGSAFRGWFNSAQSTAIKVQAGAPVNENISLYAKVTPVEVATVGSIFEYDLRAANFYPEDHELIAINGSYHGAQHGWVLSNTKTMTVQVAGNAIVQLGLCLYGSETNITVTDAASNVIATIPAKVDADGATVSVTYSGAATTLTFTMGGTAYIHGVKIFNVAGDLPTKNDAGYYVLQPGDAASLLLVLATLQPGDKIFLPNGTYDLGEQCMTTISANNVSLIGESMEGTIIRNAPHYTKEAINTTATLYNTSTGLYMQDLTLQNALDYYAAVAAGQSGARAVCLMDEGANTICKNVRMLSYQDTYYSHKASKFYWEDCEIHGTVDYLCGDGDIVYNRCLLVNESRNTTANNGECTIAAPYTSASCLWGYVFLDCRIQTLSARFNLGRAWGGESKAQYIRCQDMNNRLVANRWTVAGMNVAASKFVEYGTLDADGVVCTPASNIVTFTHSSGNKTYETVLTAEQAADYTVANIFGAWVPDEVAAQAEPEATLSNGTLSISNTADAYAIYEDDELVAIQSAANYTTTAGKTYKVRVANGRGGFSAPLTVVENTNPTALDNINAGKVEKVMRDGQIFIIKNGIIYNALGAVVK